VAKKIKKKNKRIYFGKDVQDAIVKYNSEENPAIRNKIYSEEIAYAFDKLCENIINTFKFSYFDSYFEDVKNEVVSFLVLNIHKYDETRGFKAFSYFSVIAKNYLIVLNNKNYKKLKSHSDIYETKEFNKNIYYVNNIDTALFDYNKELLKEMIKYFESNISKMFKKESDMSIAYSILELMRKESINVIENFTKKGIYILIREMTGEPTSRITKVINVLKKKYSVISKDFSSKGSIRMT
tara:strand:+ start:339 stop:1055 length:717 start_codon:yes stop_codon:yes gene_type:complete